MMAQIGEAAIGTLNFAPGTQFTVFNSHVDRITPDNAKDLPIRMFVRAVATFTASAPASGTATLELRRTRGGTVTKLYERTKSFSGSGTKTENFDIRACDAEALDGDQFRIVMSATYTGPGIPGGCGFTSSEIITQTIKV